MDKKAEEEEAEEEEEELDDDEKLQAELENLSKEEAAKRKRLKRKTNEKKMKLITRMQLNMTVPSDIGLEQEGADGQTLFNIRKISKDKSLEQLQNGDMSVVDAMMENGDFSGDEDMSVMKVMRGQGYTREMDQELQERYAVVDKDDVDELEDQLDEDYNRFLQDKAERNAKFRAKQAREEHDEWDGFDAKNSKNSNTKALNDDSDMDSDDSEASSSDNMDSDMESDDDSDDDQDMTLGESLPSEPASKTNQKKQPGTSLKKKKENSLINDLGEKAALARKTAGGLSMGASMFFDQDIFAGVGDEDMDDDEEEEDTVTVDSRKRKAEDVSRKRG